MLFNSFEFLFAFLPVCLLGFFLLGRNIRYVPVLGGSIVGNFVLGAWSTRAEEDPNFGVRLNPLTVEAALVVRRDQLRSLKSSNAASSAEVRELVASARTVAKLKDDL